MIPKSCRLFGQDHATKQRDRDHERFILKRSWSKPATFSLILPERPRKSGAFFTPADYFRSVLEKNFSLYSVHVRTRKSFGLMTRKLSVTESRKVSQFLGTLSRKKSCVAPANCPHVA